MKPTDRVILIKGDSTKWYDQAIFIVNKEMPPEKIPVDFVAEAEKIINAYLMKKNRQQPYPGANAPAVKTAAKKTAVKPAAGRRFDFILNMIMLLGCATIAGLFLFGIFG